MERTIEMDEVLALRFIALRRNIREFLGTTDLPDEGAAFVIAVSIADDILKNCLVSRASGVSSTVVVIDQLQRACSEYLEYKKRQKTT